MAIRRANLKRFLFILKHGIFYNLNEICEIFFTMIISVGVVGSSQGLMHFVAVSVKWRRVPFNMLSFISVSNKWAFCFLKCMHYFFFTTILNKYLDGPHPGPIKSIYYRIKLCILSPTSPPPPN